MSSLINSLKSSLSALKSNLSSTSALNSNNNNNSSIFNLLSSLENNSNSSNNDNSGSAQNLLTLLSNLAVLANNSNNNTSTINGNNVSQLGSDPSQEENTILDRMNMPDIDTIKDNIDTNSGNFNDIENQVELYLMDHYGGSEKNAIQNLSGLSSLPSNISSADQDQIFNQFVSKVADEVDNAIQNTSNGNDSDGNDTNTVVSDGLGGTFDSDEM